MTIPLEWFIHGLGRQFRVYTTAVRVASFIGLEIVCACFVWLVKGWVGNWVASVGDKVVFRLCRRVRVLGRYGRARAVDRGPPSARRAAGRRACIARCVTTYAVRVTTRLTSNIVPLTFSERFRQLHDLQYVYCVPLSLYFDNIKEYWV